MKSQAKIRMSIGLRIRLSTAARENDRSLNAEIIDRLERTLYFDEKWGLIEQALRRLLQTDNGA